jgi:hypothetical protein
MILIAESSHPQPQRSILKLEKKSKVVVTEEKQRTSGVVYLLQDKLPVNTQTREGIHKGIFTGGRFV